MVFCSCFPCNQFITEDKKSGMTYIILAKNKMIKQESQGKSRTMKTCLWQAFLQKNLYRDADWAIQDDVLKYTVQAGYPWCSEEDRVMVLLFFAMNNPLVSDDYIDPDIM